MTQRGTRLPDTVSLIRDPVGWLCADWYRLLASSAVTETDTPPTARERAMFEAATQGNPEEFVRLCGVIGRDPRETLDGYDAEPWRWLIVSFGSSGLAGDEAPSLGVPPAMRAQLDATRWYVDRPWWRRLQRPSSNR